MSLLDDEEAYRINAFDWQAEFPRIFKGNNRGFDAVIGNPPYGVVSDGAQVAYMRSVFATPANSLDTFLLFVERSTFLLRIGGAFGMIIPSGWVSAPSATPLRRMFLGTYEPTSFVSLPFDVFKNAYIDTIIVTAAKRHPSQKVVDVPVSLVVFPHRFCVSTSQDFSRFSKAANTKDWRASDGLEFLVTCSHAEAHLIHKILRAPQRLGDLVLVKRGIEVFHPTPDTHELTEPMAAFHGTLQRFNVERAGGYFISYPEDIRKSKPPAFFSDPRILLRQVLSRRLRLQAAYATDPFLTNQSVQSLLLRPETAESVSLLFLLGILNSKLISWYFVNVNSVARRDDFPKIIIKQTRELPIAGFETARDDQRSSREQIESTVKTRIGMQEKLNHARTEQDRSTLSRMLQTADKRIDHLVYGLYGLSEAESQIIDQNVRDE